MSNSHFSLRSWHRPLFGFHLIPLVDPPIGLRTLGEPDPDDGRGSGHFPDLDPIGKAGGMDGRNKKKDGNESR